MKTCGNCKWYKIDRKFLYQGSCIYPIRLPVDTAADRNADECRCWDATENAKIKNIDRKHNLLIEIDCDGEFCGRCPSLIGQKYTSALCGIFGSLPGYDDQINYIRLPECLAAEKAAKEVVE